MTFKNDALMMHLSSRPRFGCFNSKNTRAGRSNGMSSSIFGGGVCRASTYTGILLACRHYVCVIVNGLGYNVRGKRTPLSLVFDQAICS